MPSKAMKMFQSGLLPEGRPCCCLSTVQSGPCASPGQLGRVGAGGVGVVEGMRVSVVVRELTLPLARLAKAVLESSPWW